MPRTSFRVEQIDHVEMFVPDRYEAARWYEQVLGLRVVTEYEHWAVHPGGPLMISSDGGLTKMALFGGTPQSRGSTAGFHRVAFRVSAPAFLDCLDRLPELALTDQRGRPVTRELAVDHDRAFSIYFSDPFGHALEITTYEHEEARRALRTPSPD